MTAVTVNKISIDNAEFGKLIVPDTDAKNWQKISETETTMTIEILDKV
jgi:hypothetical protein